MAHELSFTNGKADFFSVVETAWHREGTVLDKAPTLEEALALANMNYTVEKRPLTIQGNGGGATSEKAFVTWNADKNCELGSVGPAYTVVQTRDAMAATLGPLLDAGVLKIETGGVLRNG